MLFCWVRTRARVFASHVLLCLSADSFILVFRVKRTSAGPELEVPMVSALSSHNPLLQELYRHILVLCAQQVLATPPHKGQKYGF